MPLTCPVGVFLLLPGLSLQSSKPCRGHRTVRGPVPQAPAPRRRPTVERARATCRVWGKGRAGPHLCALPLAAQASHPCLPCPSLAPTRPQPPSRLGATPSVRESGLPAHLTHFTGPRSDANTQCVSGHVACAPGGVPGATPVGGGGGCAARPAFRG